MQVQPREVVDARKHPMDAKKALALTKGIERIVAAKGTKVVEIDLKKDKPREAELLAVLLGPTGNLRAPTMRVGKTLLVGFNADTYRQELGKPV